jgi:hypothetical protein
MQFLIIGTIAEFVFSQHRQIIEQSQVGLYVENMAAYMRICQELAESIGYDPYEPV